jgi:hypothetical protein
MGKPYTYEIEIDKGDGQNGLLTRLARSLTLHGPGIIPGRYKVTVQRMTDLTLPKEQRERGR